MEDVGGQGWKLVGASGIRDARAVGRRRGVGANVEGEVVGWARQAGCQCCWLQLSSELVGALTLGGKDGKERGLYFGNHRVSLGSHLTS